MNRVQATRLDNDFNVLYDETHKCWAVFGNNSLFCYTTHESREDAEDRRQRMVEDLHNIEQDNYVE